MRAVVADLYTRFARYPLPHEVVVCDSDFRHFFPRLIELLINDKSPVFPST